MLFLKKTQRDDTMTLYKHITIKWSYPTEIDQILQTEDMNDIGIYYISRVFGKKESILYIGKTTHSFGSRLESHKEKWLDKYKGTKYVRLGRIVHPRFIFSKKRKALINDAERTIIFYLSNLDEQGLIANIASTKSTAVEHTLKIKNIGYKGQLPKVLYIPEDMMIKN